MAQSVEHTVHINGGTDPGAGFLDDAWEFGKGLWEKTKNVVKKLQNWG